MFARGAKRQGNPVGAGPTGLTAANLLGAYGIETLVIERNDATMEIPRAIVIDFKAFPFTDNEMLEWRDRLFDVYGETMKTGFGAARELAKRYESIGDARIRELRSKYGVTHAVLHGRTETSLPIVFESITMWAPPGAWP